MMEQQEILEDLEDDNNIRLQKEEDLQELKDQFKTFQQTIADLSAIEPSTVKEAQRILNRLKRETERLKARLPIYARRQQIIDTIKSNRVVIVKANTGSGKSSQLVQYLADADFAYNGSLV